MCMRGGVNGDNENARVVHSSAGSYISGVEFALPLYDERSGVNPVFHWRRLDEFMKIKNVPSSCQLAVAYRSAVGEMSRQWVEKISHQLTDYEAFRKIFLETWWSQTAQNLAKCSLYQARYDRRSNLPLSGHLRYATTASYFEPRPTDSEVIEAIRCHFPIGVQRAMLSAQHRGST
jgi:hypothetical protein